MSKVSVIGQVPADKDLYVARLRELVDAHAADMGGADAMSAAERSIIRRACVLTIELERLEDEFRFGPPADELDLYSRTAGNLKRLYEAVGMERRSKDVTPTLKEYLESKKKPGAE